MKNGDITHGHGGGLLYYIHIEWKITIPVKALLETASWETLSQWLTGIQVTAP